MPTGFFGDIKKVKYEGPDSTNPLAYRFYDKDEVVAGKRYTESEFNRVIVIREREAYRVGEFMRLIDHREKTLPLVGTLPRLRISSGAMRTSASSGNAENAL